MPDIVSATRLHLPAGATEIPEATKEHLCTYARNAERLGLVAAIAVNSFEEEIKRVAEAAAPGLVLHVLPVPCWGAFVPALNALLEFAQVKGMTHILYQSLEVHCSPVVLNKLLDHYNSNVLVVGPVLAGHVFQAGEQTLNGRTTPWNTLALWSVRKLALTGFPRIADGLTKEKSADQAQQSQAVGKPPMLRSNSEPELLGSKGWWSEPAPEEVDSASEVPAGVEEVTTIALLQHLLGRHRAIAVLVDLPDNLAGGVQWQANWGQDEARKKWHEYKMQSKVARPNAQLKELFNITSRSSRADDSSELADTDANLDFGTVMHFGSSIRPAGHLQRMCLGAVGIFYFNSTAVLSEAFNYINALSMGHPSLSMIGFSGLLIGGVYILMPISLQLTRMLTRRFDHAAGLVFFGGVLLLSHLCVIASLVFCDEYTRRAVLLAARLAQGLGSGVVFQSRFVLASLSTGDLHTNLQARAFIAGDLGLGLGALLPAACSLLAGRAGSLQPELWPAIVQALICFMFVVWVRLSFPRQLHMLPDCVRFAGHADEARAIANGTSESIDQGKQEAAKFRAVLLLSGTTRVFVQSAIIPLVALLMHDAHFTGHFRQSIAVAILFLLQLPFQAVASRICNVCSIRAPSKSGMTTHWALVGSLMVVLIISNLVMVSIASSSDKNSQILFSRLLELVGLVVTLAVAAPFNASRLYQLHDAERAIVILEWMKAYIGRLLGPFIAVLIYTQVGYGALLTLLCCATVVVTLTA